MRSRTQAVYVISVAAELAGMHPQTLRIYERKGLLEPARTAGGNRRYSDEDIERLRRISDLAAEGMNLAGIRRVMELEEEVVRLRAELERATVRRHRRRGRAERRQRRDLVPLNQAVAIYGQWGRSLDKTLTTALGGAAAPPVAIRPTGRRVGLANRQQIVTEPDGRLARGDRQAVPHHDGDGHGRSQRRRGAPAAVAAGPCSWRRPRARWWRSCSCPSCTPAGRVGPARVDVVVRPGLASDTVLGVPPFGRVIVDSHTAPLELRATIQELDVPALQRLARQDDIEGHLRTSAEHDVGALVRRALIRLLAVTLVGGAVAGLLIGRRRARARPSRTALPAGGGRRSWPAGRAPCSPSRARSGSCGSAIASTSSASPGTPAPWSGHPRSSTP